MAGGNNYSCVADDLLSRSPAEPNQSVLEPMQTRQKCDQAKKVSYHPCDIDRMMVTIDQRGPDPWLKIKTAYQKTSLLQVEPAKEPMQLELAPLSGANPNPAKLIGTVGRNSATLEIIAPPEPLAGFIGANKDGRPHMLAAMVAIATGPCGALHHPTLDVSPRPPRYRGPMPMRRCESVSFPLYSEPFLSEQSLQVASPFAFLARLWGGNKMTRTYSLVAESCGRRDSENSVGGLSLTVDVYPEALLTVSVSLPAMIERQGYRGSSTTTQTRNGSTIVTEKNVSGKESVDRFGSTASSSSVTGKSLSVTRPDGSSRSNYVETRTDEDTADDLTMTSTSKFFGDGGDSLSMDVEEAGGLICPEISFGVTFNNADISGSWKEWADRISALRKFFQTVKDLERMLNRSFQIGWKVTGSITGLEGDLSLAYGYKAYPGQFKVGEYLTVEGSLLLVQASAEASFGLCLAFGDIKNRLSSSDFLQLIDARISLTLKGSVTLKGAYERMTGTPNAGGSFQLAGAVILEAEVVIKSGKILALRGKISGGVEVVRGFTLEIGEESKCLLELYRKAVVAAVSVKIGGMTITSLSRTIIDKAPLMKPVDLVAPPAPPVPATIGAAPTTH